MTSSVRLTNLDRDTVTGAAVRTTFESRGAELKVAADKLGRACYEAVFSVKDRKAAAAMPKGWLEDDNCLRFNVGGMDVRLNLLGEGVPVPARSRGYCERLGSISDPDLVAAVTKHLNDVETLKRDRERAKASLKALLYSVTTLKALREIWPEGEPFFQGLASKTGAPGLPAPQVAELNAMLGLTAEAA